MTQTAAKRAYEHSEAGRARWKAYYIRHTDRHAARVAVSRAVRTGKLKREPCVVCGTTIKVEGHHPFGMYEGEWALDVVWLCHAHHHEAHRAESSLDGWQFVEDRLKGALGHVEGPAYS